MKLLVVPVLECFDLSLSVHKSNGGRNQFVWLFNACAVDSYCTIQLVANSFHRCSMISSSNWPDRSHLWLSLVVFEWCSMSIMNKVFVFWFLRIISNIMIALESWCFLCYVSVFWCKLTSQHTKISCSKSLHQKVLPRISNNTYR